MSTCSKPSSKAAAKSARPLKGCEHMLLRFTARRAHCPEGRGAGSQQSS